MREIKFRVWDFQQNTWAKQYEVRESMGFEFGIKDYYANIAGERMIRWSFLQFTGLKDKNGTEIYEGDILSDYTETDEGVVKSFQQVYWCNKKGAWMLDESYHQNKSEGRLLSEELKQFDYKISGNIHQQKI